MENITIGRYSTPNGVWAGWIEPANGAWIVFVAEDGHAEFYGERDPETGAVL